MNDCKKCAKEMTCNKEKCKFKSWLETKNYGVPRRDEYVCTNDIKERK